MNQRNSVGFDFGRRSGRRVVGENRGVHWVVKRSEGSVIVDTGGVQGKEEVGKPIVYEFF